MHATRFAFIHQMVGPEGENDAGLSANHFANLWFDVTLQKYFWFDSATDYESGPSPGHKEGVRWLHHFLTLMGMFSFKYHTGSNKLISYHLIEWDRHQTPSVLRGPCFENGRYFWLQCHEARLQCPCGRAGTSYSGRETVCDRATLVATGW